MTKKLPPATSFLPNRKKDLVMLTPRVPRILAEQIASAVHALNITTQDFCEAAFTRYLEELRVEGAIQ